MNKKVIPIFFTIDDKYVPYMDIAIRSMMKNSSKDYSYIINVLYQGLSEDTINELYELVDGNEDFDINMVPMEEGLGSITDRKENRLRCDYFTLSIYFRLFIPEMFPEYDKGIYIDSDIVVTGDISELFNIDLESKILGATNDKSILEIPELINYLENGIGVNKFEYINSGVLLMDLKQMREKKFTEKFLYLLNKYHFDSVAPDQDYLNAMCNGQIKYIDESWDAMPNDNNTALEKPNLIHYNLFQKPWCYDNIQYGDIFWEYAKESKYYEEVVKFKKNYSDNDKRSDSECLQTLVKKSDMIPGQDVTFKKINDTVESVRV